MVICGEPATPDESALLAEGRALIESLPGLELGGTQKLHFELYLGPNDVVGYSQILLRCEERGGKTQYIYASDTVVSAGAGPRIALAMRATLWPTFEPIHAELWRENMGAENQRQVSNSRAEFGEDGVAITITGGQGTASKKAARPDPPFVFGVETLIALLKGDKPARFAIREFSVPTGTAEPLILTRDEWPGGGVTLVGKYPDGNGAYQFWFDTKGELQRWMHASTPMLFVRSTAERIEELKKSLGPPLTVPEGKEKERE